MVEKMVERKAFSRVELMAPEMAVQMDGKTAVQMVP
jgi:hypothetical protein